MTGDNSEFLAKLAAISRDMDDARRRSPLAAGLVTLTAVSKTVPAGVLEAAITAGIGHFGENRVQEAAEKWPALKKQHQNVRLHLIGPLQTNKVREALGLFEVIETIDREKLVDAIASAMSRLSDEPMIQKSNERIIESPNHRIIEFYVQVNTGDEPQKAGVSLAGADVLIAYAKQKGLNVTGLMCVPPVGENPGPHFAMLRNIASRNNLPNLSMGMSGDFQIAIGFGATHVRIGSALFGERA